MMKINMTLLLVPIAMIVILGCSEKTEDVRAEESKSRKAPAAAQVDVSSAPAVTISPEGGSVKSGQTLTLTGTLSHIPSGQNRWQMSLGWTSSDGQRDAQALKKKDGKYVTTADFVWSESGTYDVTLSYFGGNAKLVEKTVSVVVE